MVKIHSVFIAEKLGLHHRNLMANIRKLECFVKNFNPRKKEWVNKQKRQYTGYELVFEDFCVLMNNLNIKRDISGGINEILEIYKETSIKPSHTYSRFEVSFFDELETVLEYIVDIERQYCVDKYRVDGYIVEYDLVIEYDEESHKYQKTEDEIREEYIKKELNCKFLRLDYKETNAHNIALVLKEIFEQDTNLLLTDRFVNESFEAAKEI